MFLCTSKLYSKILNYGPSIALQNGAAETAVYAQIAVGPVFVVLPAALSTKHTECHAA